MLGSPIRAGMADEPENFVMGFLLPGLFTLVLLICMLYLGYGVTHGQAQELQAVTYATSAFAN